MTKIYPVIFFTFKRSATTTQFLELMKDAGVKKIYIFSDGPRNPIEKKATDLVKSIIMPFQSANPSIEIITNFSEDNLGLKNSIISGLNKVFLKEVAAIIIEDDCLPHRDFFHFCNEMLDRYKNNSDVMSVNGTSVGGDSDYSYDFTRYAQCWGWATWARSWKLYDAQMPDLGTKSWTQLARNLWGNPVLRWYWNSMLQLVQNNRINTWDFQWSYAHFLYAGLAIAPSSNLIKNIGFDQSATNTKTRSSVANLETASLQFPLTHPPKVIENMDITNSIENKFYNNPIAILGMLRQYFYWMVDRYAHRD